jgi:NHLM bacteriocin system secretion protein
MVAAEKSMDAAKETYEEFVEEKETAEQKYENAKAIYIEKVEGINQAQAYQSELGNRYNVISNQYNNEKSAIQNLEDSVAQSQIQINVTKAYILSSLKTEYKQYLDQKEASEIKATSDGRISDFAVAVGSVLGQGTEVAKIQMGDNSDRVVVCYVPVSDGRKVQKDMKVLIYPSTVNKQEYGHMEATVVSVDDYITSTTDMQQQLGDSNLVELFMQNGPVVEVRCELKEDASTVSGYYWSSNKGASVNIDGGTMVEASVVISEKPPISLLIPFLKEKLTIKADN